MVQTSKDSNTQESFSMTIYNNFCVYLTTYSGNKLPPFYIGSSSIDSVLNKNYRGSSQSKKYGTIWKFEIKNNPELFKTAIISNHATREEAIIKELFLQKCLNVVKSTMYINQAYAQPSGFFGMDNSGVNHPSFGVAMSDKTKLAIGRGNYGKKHPINAISNKNPEHIMRRAAGYKKYALNEKLKRFNVNSRDELVSMIDQLVKAHMYFTKHKNINFNQLSKHFLCYNGTTSAISAALRRAYFN